jgi:WD40 repeat protein
MVVRLLQTSTGHRGAVYALLPGAIPDTVVSCGSDGWLTQWDAGNKENGHLIAQIPGHVFSIARIENSHRWVAGHFNGGLYWIQPGQKEPPRWVTAHQHAVFALLQVENELLSVGGDGLLIRWDTARGLPIDSIKLSAKALRCLDYYPPTREIAVGSSDGSIFLIDAGHLEIRQQISHAHQPTVFALAYTQTGNLLSGGRDALLKWWNLTDKPTLTAVVPAHLQTINHLSLSPSQQWLATGSRDRTIKIWEAKTLKLRKVLEPVRDHGHRNSVNRLLWLTDELLVTAGDDSTLKWWHLEGN